MAEPKTRLKHIEIEKIRPPAYLLREKPKADNAKYVEFVDSISKDGVRNPIVVREFKDPQTGETLYSLVDGYMRYCGAQDAGLGTIPANIISLEQGNVIEASMVLNLHKIEMSPGQYSKALVALFNQNPTLTVDDVASKVSKSRKWVEDRVGLATLPDHVIELLDDRKISVTNAHAISKLKEVAPDEVDQYLTGAQTLPPTEFVAQISNRIKTIKDARRAGKKEDKRTEYEPNPFPQSPATIKREWENPDEVLSVLRIKHLTDENGNLPDVVQQTMRAILEWCVHMDPVSLEKGLAKFTAERQAQEEEKEKKRLERAAKKQAEDDAKLRAAAKSTADVLEPVEA